MPILVSDFLWSDFGGDPVGWHRWGGAWDAHSPGRALGPLGWDEVLKPRQRFWVPTSAWRSHGTKNGLMFYVAVGWWKMGESCGKTRWFQWDHDGKWMGKWMEHGWEMDGKWMDDVRKHGILWHIFRPTLPWGEWCHGAEGTCAMPNTEHPSWMGCGGPCHGPVMDLWWIALFWPLILHVKNQWSPRRIATYFFTRFFLRRCGGRIVWCQWSVLHSAEWRQGLRWSAMMSALSHTVRKAVVTQWCTSWNLTNLPYPLVN